MIERLRGAWARTPRVWVGGVAVADLVARVPFDATIPTVSLLGGTIGTPFLETLTTWLLVVGLLYLFAPLAYGLSDALPRRAFGFRAIFAGGTAVTSVLMPFVLSAVGLAAFVVVWIVSLFAVGGVFLWYLSSVRRWALLDPDGPALEVLDWFFPGDDVAAELEEDAERSDLLGRLTGMDTLAALGLVLAIPTVPAAFITLAIVDAYPIPDLLALGWIAATSIPPSLSPGFVRRRVLSRRFDLERTLIDAVENATRSLQGMTLTMAISLGLVMTSIYLWGAVVTVPWALAPLTTELPSVLARRDVTTVVGAWDRIGITTSFLAAGGMALRGWITEFERLPHFLDDWEDRTTTRGRPPSRPPGVVLLPAALGAGTLGFLSLVGFTVLTDDPVVLHYLFAGSWPVAVFGVWFVHRTWRRRPSQPVTAENYWIVGGVLLQAYAVGGPLALYSPTWEHLFSLVAFTFVAVAVAGLPAVRRYERTNRSKGTIPYPLVATLLVLGGGALAGFALGPLAFRNLFLVAVVAFVGGGSLLGLIRWYDERT